MCYLICLNIIIEKLGKFVKKSNFKNEFLDILIGTLTSLSNYIQLRREGRQLPWKRMWLYQIIWVACHKKMNMVGRTIISHKKFNCDLEIFLNTIICPSSASLLVKFERTWSQIVGSSWIVMLLLTLLYI